MLINYASIIYCYQITDIVKIIYDNTGLQYSTMRSLHCHLSAINGCVNTHTPVYTASEKWFYITQAINEHLLKR